MSKEEKSLFSLVYELEFLKGVFKICKWCHSDVVGDPKTWKTKWKIPDILILEPDPEKQNPN